MPTTNPYLALGVRPFINCCSVRTMHGGSLMLPQYYLLKLFLLFGKKNVVLQDSKYMWH